MAYSNLSKNEELIIRVLNEPSAPLIAFKIMEQLQLEQKRREEFYNSIETEELKTEFINGEVVIHSPVKKLHNVICSNLFKMLDAFVIKHDLGFIGYEKIMIRLTRNDYEPDLCFFNKEKAKSFKDDTSLFPAPDLAVEIASPKTIDRDRGIKYQDYAQHKISEYWIILPEEKTVEQYLLSEEKGVYELTKKSDSGLIALKSLQGLEISIPAIFDRKLAQEEVLRIYTGA